MNLIQLLGGAALAAFCLPVRSQAPLSAPERASALRSIRAIFAESYVFPDMRPIILKRLEQGEQSGRYGVDDPRTFAQLITTDLQEVSHDRHLSLRVDAAAYAAALAPAASEDGQEAFRRREAIRNHHGLAATRLLPGNVRYLKITDFQWVKDETGICYDEAMRFLKEGDALIIDLRGNGGGSHAAVRYLVSHFLDGDLLELTFLEGAKPPIQSRTLDHVPAGRLMGKPLYVLIDSNVASAAEAFAYDIQQFKLGELVGARTAGAANNNNLLPVAPGFILSVSYGRPVHAVSQSNWEGTGIQPSVAAPPTQALELAQSLALAKLAAAPEVSPVLKAEYLWARAAAEAALHPIALGPAQAQALTGRYGTMTVSLREESLCLDWPGYPQARLTPMAEKGLFAYEGADYLRVRLTRARLEVIWADGRPPRIHSRN